MNRIKRYEPDITKGLSKNQLKQRKKDELINVVTDVPTKTVKQIFLMNIFTLFNILNFFLAFLICMVHSYKNLFFMGGIICNTLISIVQEIRTKRIIDKLSLLKTSKVKVIRNEKKESISVDEIVLDDIITYKVGDQIPVDTIIKSGKCEVNESFLTGEEELVEKKEGDMILSGSFIVTGHVIGKVEHIGLDNYAAKISKEARYVKKSNSVLMKSLNTIIKWVSIIIVPVGFILFVKQYSLGGGIESAIVNTVAGVIGLIPEGLVLLTSTVLAVAIIKVSKYNVLVQELYCIEMLARVDTLCLDKTGTITEGKMEVYDIIPEEGTITEIEDALSMFSLYSEDDNATMMAIKKSYHAKVDVNVKDVIPFKSENKYSGLVLDDKTYLLGAPEVLLDKTSEVYQKQMKLSKEYRVMVLTSFISEEEKHHQKILGFILIRDVVRKEAIKTLEYFKKQGVDIKVISGDNPITVSNIAKRVGINHYDKVIDLSEVKDEDIEKIASEYTIFGRVKPNQKKIIIKSLQKQKHTVAMTGDGVNDVLALKEADCSIAMNSGSDAARNVSNIVLLDNNFDAMPKVLEEGRGTINNIERSASLFLTKTTYTALLVILFLFINKPYPFEPIQLTLTSVVAIGIPSFILALEPNKKLVKGNFFSNVLVKSFPNAIVIVIDIILIMILSSIYGLNKSETSTLCVILNAFVSFQLLYRLSKPLDFNKTFLLVSMILTFIIEVLGFKSFYSLSEFNLTMILLIIVLMALSLIILDDITKIFTKYFEKKYK